MTKRVQQLVREQVEDEADNAEDILEFISEGDGEPLSSLEEPVKLNESFPSALFICGLPKVGKEKFDKLNNVLGKLIDKYGKCDRHMPFNAEGTMTEGCIIANFDDVPTAENALKSLDGMALDKKHVFKVIKLDDYDKIANRQEEFVPQRTLSTYSRADFRDWLGDKKCREQILLRYQTETEIYWHDTNVGEPVLCYGGEREKAQKKIWCDWRVQWSPHGHFLATFHQQGIALWAGPAFEKKVRFAHHGVKFIDFSPNEEYVLTWNGTTALENDEQAVRIHRVLTGECVHKCRTPTVAPSGGDFPHFLWSPDGQYLAECNDSAVLVRETETFQLIKDEEGKKKSFKFPELSTFQWSPKDNVLSVWCLEKENNPARLTLLEIPSRKELSRASRTQVEASLHWQSEGDYLCLINTKLSKTKKKGATNLEIFRFRERDIPVDTVEVKDSVRGFFWESKGSRFVVLTSDESGHRPKMFVYGLRKEKCQLIKEFNLPSNSFNQCYWAPEGQYFVCAGLEQGDLLFCGVTPDDKLEILHKDEHFMLKEVHWDPSSRYVITAVTQPMQSEIGGFKYSMEAGFAIWTFQGRVLYRQQKEKLWQVAWRPHPPSMLSAQQQENVRTHIKKYSKKYDAHDDKAKEDARNAVKNERDGQLKFFQKVLARLDDYKYDRREENGWADFEDRYQASQEWERNEEILEEEVNVTEEKIQ